ncbi:hypothetical protein GCM10007904_11440 [Oharaeibacter diazotrophicus]|nr:hypothetical protein GCM10007904_11440 [Oharaeibacter diazotrophicus]
MRSLLTSSGASPFPPGASPFPLAQARPHPSRAPSPLEGEGWGEGADAPSSQRVGSRIGPNAARGTASAPLSLSLPFQGGGDAVEAVR